MTTPPVESVPPPFLRLAGHPLRWRLMAELARSDMMLLAGAGLLISSIGRSGADGVAQVTDATR